MSQNPNLFNLIFKTYESIAQCLQTNLSHFIGDSHHHPSSHTNKLPPLFSISSSSPSSTTTISHIDPSLHQSHTEIFNKAQAARPVTKEGLGRSTWTLLHTIAAQFPDRPTRQQKKDVKELMAILSRLYPCKECADHFKEILSANPVQAGNQAEFSQWLCHVHNVVNRSLGKPVFPCRRVDARWGKLECENRACDVEGAGTDLGR